MLAHYKELPSSYKEQNWSWKPTLICLGKIIPTGYVVFKKFFLQAALSSKVTTSHHGHFSLIEEFLGTYFQLPCCITGVLLVLNKRTFNILPDHTNTCS